MSLDIILMTLIIGSFITYLISRSNEKVGGYFTILVTLVAMIMIYILKDNIGATLELFGVLTFKVSYVGWFFTIIMVTVYFSAAFFNPFWMDKLLYPSQYNLMYLLSFIGTIGLFFANDLLTIFIFWEITVWTSTFIIPLGKSRKAGVMYYVISSIGSMALLYTLLLLFNKFGTLELNKVFTALVNDPKLASIIFVMFLLSGLTKMGIFPFHIWLPMAHGNAPNTFSPVLSGGLVKMGGFITFLSVGVFPAYKAFENGVHVFGIPILIYIMMLLGAVSIIVGTAMAIKSDDAKKLLAYSSVANGGYILIGILLADQLGLAGGMMHMLNHAFASAASFLAIAAVAYKTKTTKISELGGMIHKMPVTYTVFLISIISLAGIPPMGGFVSKWLIIQAVADKGLLFIAFAAFFGSIGSFLYVFRPLSALFLGQVAERHEHLTEVNKVMLFPMVFLAGLILYFGVLPRRLLELIGKIQSNVGITPVELNGNEILAINGSLNSLKVFIIFGFGFILALILYLLFKKPKRVELMDTYTSAEFIYTKELYHYSHDFYAPIERLYKNHPSVQKWADQLAYKVKEVGQLVNKLFFNFNPSLTVLWITALLVVIYLGGVIL